MLYLAAIGWTLLNPLAFTVCGFFPSRNTLRWLTRAPSRSPGPGVSSRHWPAHLLSTGFGWSTTGILKNYRLLKSTTGRGLLALCWCGFAGGVGRRFSARLGRWFSASIFVGRRFSALFTININMLQKMMFHFSGRRFSADNLKIQQDYPRVICGFAGMRSNPSGVISSPANSGQSRPTFFNCFTYSGLKCLSSL